MKYSRLYKTLARLAIGVISLASVSVMAQQRVSVSGNVLFGSVPLCALVLINGESQFSCDGSGRYDLNVPLDGNGQVKIQSFADGFAPVSQVLTPSGDTEYQINMFRDENGRLFSVRTELLAAATEGHAIISGEVDSAGEPVCALVLANGQSMFSCGSNHGNFSLEVPLDASANVTLQIFAAGFQPYKRVMNGLQGSFGRYTKILVDLDNNGRVDEEIVPVYTDEGLFESVTWSYVGDDTVDLMNSTSDGGTAAYYFEFDDAGRMTHMNQEFDPAPEFVTPYTLDRAEIEHVYGEEGELVSATRQFYDRQGHLVSDISWDFFYNDGRLINFDRFDVDSSVSPAEIGEYEYRPDGLVSKLTQTAEHSSSEAIHEWTADGMFLRKTTTYSFSPLAWIVEAYYDEMGRLSRSISYNAVFQGDGTLFNATVDHLRDENGRLIRQEIDLDNDGSIDATREFEWEEEPCLPVLLLDPGIPANYTLDEAPSSHYAPGTGFIMFSGCQDRIPLGDG